MIEYEIWDVFTDRAYGGNPLAVVLDGRGLSTGQMQAIAREFNLSETTFVLPPETEGALARVRIFTTASELPFAGHPTIGTAICLRNRGNALGVAVDDEMVLDEGVGPIVCGVSRSDNGWQARFVTETPFQEIGAVDPALVARCLRLEPSQVMAADDAPVLASKGVPFVCARLANMAALRAMAHDAQAFQDNMAAHPEANDHFVIYAYVLRDDGRVAARMFGPPGGITEDPATGSAAAALGALLCERRGKDIQLIIDQGVEMGRPSQIGIEASKPTANASRVAVTGQAVQVMQGRLNPPA